MFPLLIFSFAASSPGAAGGLLTSHRHRIHDTGKWLAAMKTLGIFDPWAAAPWWRDRLGPCRAGGSGEGSRAGGGGRLWAARKSALGNHCDFSRLFWNCKCCKVTTREPQPHVRGFVLNHGVKTRIHYNSAQHSRAGMQRRNPRTATAVVARSWKSAPVDRRKHQKQKRGPRQRSHTG